MSEIDKNLKKATVKMEAELRLFESDEYRIKAYKWATVRIITLKAIAILGSLASAITTLVEIFGG
jgi:hypothetical protein